MQTFLPYSMYDESAKCLDYKRLGKQRIEAWQIYLSLTEDSYGWKQHPIVKMWKGYEKSLLKYGIAICLEWRDRGYKDTMLEKFRHAYNSIKGLEVPPWWMGIEKIHSSHRANLLRKDIKYYSKYKWTESPLDPYFWADLEV